MSLLSFATWKSVWNWCKVNWKFIVGFAIPCLILYFINAKKARNILKKGIEFRKSQLAVNQKAADVELAGVKRNAEEFVNRVEEVTTKHEEALRKLDDSDQARRKKLGGSDAADLTDVLAEKFDLDNGDKK